MGSCNANERKHMERGDAYKHYVLIDPGVHVGQSQRGCAIPEEMVEGPESAIRYIKDVCSVGTGVD